MSGTVNNASSNAIGALGKLGDEINVPELIMAIQIERSGVLDTQIRGQMSDMQARNDWLKDSNAALGALRSAHPPSDTATVDSSTLTFVDHTGKTQLVAEWAAANGISASLSATPAQNDKLANAQSAQGAFNDAANNWTYGDYAITKSPTYTTTDGQTASCYEWAKENGVKTMPSTWGSAGDMPPDAQGNYVMTKDTLTSAANDAATVVAAAQAEVDEANNPTGADFDSAISNFKSTIDTVNSQSQMDMVRLQGLMDKRNQAFDMMTNTLSKSGKSIDSVTSNMR